MKVDGKSMRSIWLEPDGWSVGVDRPDGAAASPGDRAPTTLAERAMRSVPLVIRGAPLIGATAAYGVCLALRARRLRRSARDAPTPPSRHAPDRDQS